LLFLAGLTVGCGKKDKDLVGGGDGSTGGATTDEKVALQGKWSAVRLEVAFAPDSTQELVKRLKHDQDELVANGELFIKDNLIAATVLKENSPSYVVFAIDASKSPKEVDLVAADEKGTPQPEYTNPTRSTAKRDFKEVPPTKVHGIYKLDGDTLMVAVALGKDAQRPKEFKPVAPKRWNDESGGVVVLHLKKK